MDRRDFIVALPIIAIATAELAPLSGEILKPLARGVETAIKHERGSFPLTEQFIQANFVPYPALAHMSHAELEAVRTELLALSNIYAYRLYSYPQDRHDLLEAVTNVVNVHRALDVFDDYEPGDYGFRGADQLHGNLYQFGCGCALHFTLDDEHRRAFAKDDQVVIAVHPHRIVRVCQQHRHLTTFKELYGAHQAIEDKSLDA